MAQTKHPVLTDIAILHVVLEGRKRIVYIVLLHLLCAGSEGDGEYPEHRPGESEETQQSSHLEAREAHVRM